MRAMKFCEVIKYIINMVTLTVVVCLLPNDHIYWLNLNFSKTFFQDVYSNRLLFDPSVNNVI